MVCLQSLHSVGVVTIVFFNYMPYILVPFSFDNITWVLLIFFFLFDITWCMCCQDYGLYFGGGSYSSVYVPPPIYVLPMVLILHIPSFFFFSVFCMLISLSICTPMFSILPFVYFFTLG